MKLYDGDATIRDASADELFEPGEYVVTDPCYVLEGELYDVACHTGRMSVMEIETDRGKFKALTFHTAYGDGGYPVYLSGELIGTASVDSGMLGFFPIGLFGGDGNGEVVAKVPGRVVPVALRDGDVQFGAAEVYTSDDDPHKEDADESEKYLDDPEDDEDWDEDLDDPDEDDEAPECPIRPTPAKPVCKLTGTDGNVFAVIGNVEKALRKAGLPEAAKEWRTKAMESDSYDAVLALAFKYVDVE